MHRPAIALCICLGLGSLPAFSAAIGVVQANGGFRVDDNPVAGNATLFEGNTIETGKASSDLRLNGGARLSLAPNSRGKVFGSRLLLEKGAGEWSGAAGYAVEAQGLRILADSPGSAGRVAISGDRKVQATALAGSLHVTTTDGTVVAWLKPGAALEFEPQAVTGAQAPFQMTGCVINLNGRFVVKDPVSGVTEEVRGGGIEKEAGNTVEMTAAVIPGVEPVSGAQEVVQITRLRRVARGCAAPGPQASASSGQGMSGAKKAIIAGVIVGGAGAGAAVYLETRNSGTPSTISP
jgi:hypothetical protein